jgi:hypothetical protein
VKVETTHEKQQQKHITGEKWFACGTAISHRFYYIGDTEGAIPHKGICPKADRDLGKLSSGTTGIVLKEVLNNRKD